MLRTILTLILLTSLLINVSSQSQSIEIEVTDTISAIPDEYGYMLTLNGHDDDPFSMSKEHNNISLEELNQLITKYDDIQIIENQTPTLTSDVFKSLLQSISIKVKSLDSITELFNDLEEYSNISGQATSVEILDDSPIRLQLKQKILNKAKKRASITAQLIDGEIGQIESISESEMIDETNLKLNEDSGWTAYPPLSNIAQMFGIPNKTFTKKIYFQTMRVKYRLK